MVRFRDRHVVGGRGSIRVYEYGDGELSLNELSRLEICVVCKATLSGRIQQNLHSARTQWRTMHQMLTTSTASGKKLRVTTNELRSKPPCPQRQDFIEVMMMMKPTSGIERIMGSMPICVSRCTMIEVKDKQ